MPDPQETKRPRKKEHNPRRILNPKRCQSLLKRVHEAMMADAKSPQLSAKEKLEYLKLGAEYSKILSLAETRRQINEKQKVKEATKAESKAASKEGLFNDNFFKTGQIG
jgi:hypothetical protein